MKKIFTLLLLGSGFASYCQSNPGGIGTTNLTAWFRADDLSPNSSVTSWWSTYPVAGIELTPVNALGPYPYATNMPAYNAANYNATVDFTGSIDAANLALMYSPAGTLNLLNNSTSTGTGTMFVVYHIPDPNVTISTSGQHIMQYRESSTSGDGIQLRRLSGTNRLAIGNTANVNATKDFSENFKPIILSYKGNYLNSMGAYQNNKTIPAATVASTSTGYKGLYIGTRRNQTTGVYEGSFPGYISEVIFYSTNLTTTEYARVNSYLAIKYGITLDNSASAQNGNGNYVASDGTVIWDATSSTAYQNDVIGIGLDNSEGLAQRQSHSFNDSLRLYVGTLATSNADNLATLNADKSYVTIGHNNAPTCNASGSTEYPSGMGITGRIDREWKIAKTNFSDAFSIDIVLDPCVNIANFNTTNIQILADYDDGNFSNAALFGAGDGVMLGLSGNTLTIYSFPASIVPATGTVYFTLVSMNSSTPLPVETIALNAHTERYNNVKLNWNSTLLYSTFDILRSTDAQQWTTINKINANINEATQFHSFTDNGLAENQYYYKIAGTDKAGKVHNSAVKHVIVGKSIRSSLSISPNPAQENIQLVSAGAIETWKISDLFNRDVTSFCVASGTGSILSINVSNIAPGTYIINTNQGKCVFVKK